MNRALKGYKQMALELKIHLNGRKQIGLVARRTWGTKVLVIIIGLALLYAALLSVDYRALTLSVAASEAPVQLIIFAFVNTLLLSYFALSSSWTGWKEWSAAFALLYGMVYFLTALEASYLGSILTLETVTSLIINGAITSAIFCGALVWTLGNKPAQLVAHSSRLKMPAREWIWKILLSAVVYLFLFLIFGAAVYMPIARLLDPVAFASEQSIASSAASLVFPIELIRGALWSLLAVPAVIALTFGWKKTGLFIGLLMAVPLTLSQFLSRSETVGLQIAHSFEIAGANIVFGFLLVWILHIHSRLPTDGLSGSIQSTP